LTAKVIRDEFAQWTTIVVSSRAPKKKVAALAKRVTVVVAPLLSRFRKTGRMPVPLLDLRWLMKKLGAEGVTSILVEGGGETNASFLLNGLAQRVAFFYAPKILGGRGFKAVAGEGVKTLAEAIQLEDVEWKKVGGDLMMEARVR